MSAFNSNHHFTEEIFRIPFITIPTSRLFSFNQGYVPWIWAFLIGCQGSETRCATVSSILQRTMPLLPSSIRNRIPSLDSLTKTRQSPRRYWALLSTRNATSLFQWANAGFAFSRILTVGLGTLGSFVRPHQSQGWLTILPSSSKRGGGARWHGASQKWVSDGYTSNLKAIFRSTYPLVARLYQ
jgi:hypothetical protein